MPATNEMYRQLLSQAVSGSALIGGGVSGGCCGSALIGGAISAESRRRVLERKEDYYGVKLVGKKYILKAGEVETGVSNDGRRKIKYPISREKMVSRLDKASDLRAANKAAYDAAINSYRMANPTKRGNPGNVPYAVKCAIKCEQKTVTHLIKNQAKSQKLPFNETINQVHNQAKRNSVLEAVRTGATSLLPKVGGFGRPKGVKLTLIEKFNMGKKMMENAQAQMAGEIGSEYEKKD